MNLDEFLKSKSLNRTTKIIIAGLILLLVFACGITIGLEKARFSYNVSENYYRNIAGPPRFFVDKDYVDAHGSSGQILKISGNTLTIRSSEGVEKTVEITGETSIRQGRQEMNVSNLKTNDSVVVIGSPNNEGEIEAAFIRVMGTPPPPPFISH